MAVPIPNAKARFFDANGDPLSGGKLYTYQAGTTTDLATYTTAAGTVANANPVVLDANGEADVWLAAGTYKFVLKNSADVTQWTVDNIPGINTGLAYQSITTTDTLYASDSGTFKLTTGTFTLNFDDAANLGADWYVWIKVNTGTLTLDPYSTQTIDGASTATMVAGESRLIQCDGSNLRTVIVQVVPQMFCQGRLTLTTAVPVTTSDVTAATTLYFTPYGGNLISLYDGAAWKPYTFTEVSIAVPATTSTMYDVWGYVSSGALTLELLAWTNDTTRATALTTSNGAYVKTGDATRRYLGSFRTTGVSGQTEDSFAKRYVWNYYNRVARPMKVVEATASWTYTTDTWRQANAAAANQLDFVRGVAEDEVIAFVHGAASNSGTAGKVLAVGIALDATNTNNATICQAWETNVANYRGNPRSEYRAIPSAGRHYLAWTEYSTASDTTTWLGTNGLFNLSGIAGTVWG